MISVDVETNKIKVHGIGVRDDFISKEFTSKDKFFKWFEKQVNSGIIEFTSSDKYKIKYLNLKDDNEYWINVECLSEVEHKKFLDLIELSNSKLNESKRNLVKAEKDANKSNILKEFKKESIRAVKNGMYFVNNCFGLSISLGIIVLLSKLGLEPSVFSFMPLAYTFVSPIVKSYISAKDIISNGKYQLKPEEFEKLNKEKTKTKEELKLEKSLEDLKKIEETEIPTLDEQVAQNMNIFNELLNKLNNYDKEIYFLEKLKSATEEYSKEEDYSDVESSLDLKLIDMDVRKAKFLTSIQQINIELKNALKGSIIDDKIAEFNKMYANYSNQEICEEVCEEVTDELSDSGVCKLSK